MVEGMDESQPPTDIADSAHQLQRAAGHVQQRASGPGAVTALPAALAHLEEALERLATGAIKSAQAVEDWESESDPALQALSPPARALRWHLFHLSARLRGAQDACPDARRWARELLREPEVEDAAQRQPAEPIGADGSASTARDGGGSSAGYSRREPVMQLRAHGGAAAE